MNMDFFSQQIEAAIPDCKATVTGDGSKFEAVVISEQFSGLTLLKKHQRVYAALNEHITSGTIHALTIKAYTPDEWQAQQK